MKRIGPELKMPSLKRGELKAPAFLIDLYADLRDRRLLPLLALLFVAIVATPILIGRSAPPESVAPTAPSGGTSEEASGRSLTIVRSEPGLRNYKKRLGHRTATNPFEQRFSGPRLGGGHLNSPTITTTSTETGTEQGGGGGTAPESVTTTPPAGPPSDTPAGGGGHAEGDGEGDAVPAGGLTYYTFAVNLQITKIETTGKGKKERTGPTTHEEVMPPTPLPGDKAQVVTYMGISPKDRKPLFLVSPKVQSVFGEGKCVSGEESCQLIELEPGFPETFVYGENQVRYKVNVLKVVPKTTGHS